MTFKKLTNIIGDIFHYPRCPVTHETTWRKKLIGIPYSKSGEIYIEEQTLDSYKPNEISRAVYLRAVPIVNGDRKYTQSEILKEITDLTDNL